MRRKLEKGKVVDEDFADLAKLVELGLSKKIPDFLTSKKFKGSVLPNEKELMDSRIIGGSLHGSRTFAGSNPLF